MCILMVISIIVLSSMIFLFGNVELLLGSLIFTCFYLLLGPLGGSSGGIILDSVSRLMVCLCLIVIIWYVICDNSSSFIIFLGGVICISASIMFIVVSVFWIFVWFECSLLPICCILVLTGVQYERVSAVLYLFMYTVVFGSPFLLGVFVNSDVFCSLELIGYQSNVELNMVVCVMMLAFLMKVPMFLFHAWLPNAHLESGLTGSVVLAGILLKIGVYGVVRLVSVLEAVWYSGLVFSVSLVGACVSSWLSLSSSDTKISVAYSSVSHMNLVLASCMGSTSVVLQGVILASLCHSVVSVGLFYYVTAMYRICGSRSFVVNKGLGSLHPVLGLSGYLLWSLNISLPPSLAFVAELLLVSSIIYYVSVSIILVLMLFIFITSCFCIMCCIILHHSSVNPYCKGQVLSDAGYLIVLFSIFMYVLYFINEIFW